MPFFDLIIRWVASSDFRTKTDDLGHRILKSDFIPSDFAKSDCISKPILFSDRKIQIRSSESDRTINGLRWDNNTAWNKLPWDNQPAWKYVVWVNPFRAAATFLSKKHKTIEIGVRALLLW